MVKASASRCSALSSALGSCWSFPVPLTCPLLLAQNIGRPSLPVSPFFKQQLGTNTLCLYSMFQRRLPKPFANISSSLLHLSLFSPGHSKKTGERSQYIMGWEKSHLKYKIGVKRWEKSGSRNSCIKFSPVLNQNFLFFDVPTTWLFSWWHFRMVQLFYNTILGDSCLTVFCLPDDIENMTIFCRTDSMYLWSLL